MLAHALVAVAAVQAVAATPLKRAACSPLELVIARGTSESGTYGQIVGDPLFAAAKLLVPGVTAYAVNYPASIDCGSRIIGINDAVAHVKAQVAACPDQKFALVGYSQGADVVDAAANRLLSAKLDGKVVAITEFGNPNNRGAGQIDPLGGLTVGPLPAALAKKQRQNCILGDPVCTNNGAITTNHLLYSTGTYIPVSAGYISQQFKSGGTSGPSTTGTVPPGQQTDANVAALQLLGTLLGAPANATANCASVS